MESIGLLTQLAQLGATAILLVILYFLWQEFKEQNKFIREQLMQSEAERKVLAAQIGMSTQQLKFEAQEVRRRMENAPNN